MLKKIINWFKFGRYLDPDDAYICKAQFAFEVDGKLFDKFYQAEQYRKSINTDMPVNIAKVYLNDIYEILGDKI